MALSDFHAMLMVITDILTLAIKYSSGSARFKDVILWFGKLLNGPLILNLEILLAVRCLSFRYLDIYALGKMESSS